MDKNRAGTTILRRDALGRVTHTREQREALLDEFERSGLKGPPAQVKDKPGSQGKGRDCETLNPELWKKTVDENSRCHPRAVRLCLASS